MKHALNEEKALRYNEGKLKWSLVHFKSLEPLVRVLMYGAEKYTVVKEGVTISGAHNWKKGLNRKEILESMQRHLASLIDGEEVDSESGISHIGHIGCNAMFYTYMKENNLGGEDNIKNEQG